MSKFEAKLINGFKKGGIRQIFDVITTIISFISALLLNKEMAFQIPLWNGEKILGFFEVDRIIWFFILMAITKLFCKIIIWIFMGKRDDKKVSFISRLLGVILAFFKIGIIYGFLVLLCLSPFIQNGDVYIEQGPLKPFKEIMIDIFDDEDLEITLDTCADDIEDWDSLAQMNIMVSVSKQLKVKFSVEEIASLHNVGDLVKAVEAKLL